ncbi:MAG: class I SAM-dependent methyltransferase [Acidobacteriota bacterium]|nr:class I SAM-dependent methyltransferase [Acidobacteriota bacterium]
MSQFIRIPDRTLMEIVAKGRKIRPEGHSRIPPEYFSPIPPIRWVFWQRLRMIRSLIQKYAGGARNCLDFGGGGGVLAPTLAGCFEEVVLLDLATYEADLTIQTFNLNNVILSEADATGTDLGEDRFDAAVAADVLEHFRDLEDAVTPLLRWLKPGGLLFTSLPTETLVYEFLRFVFRTKKPEDHYHRAVDVERYLEQRNFERLERLYSPLLIPLTSLFYVSAWRKKE